VSDLKAGVVGYRVRVRGGGGSDAEAQREFYPMDEPDPGAEAIPRS
jgi:hypothetical protein